MTNLLGLFLVLFSFHSIWGVLCDDPLKAVAPVDSENQLSATDIERLKNLFGPNGLFTIQPPNRSSKSIYFMGYLNGALSQLRRLLEIGNPVILPFELQRDLAADLNLIDNNSRIKEAIENTYIPKVLEQWNKNVAAARERESAYNNVPLLQRTATWMGEYLKMFGAVNLGGLLLFSTLPSTHIDKNLVGYPVSLALLSPIIIAPALELVAYYEQYKKGFPKDPRLQPDPLDLPTVESQKETLKEIMDSLNLNPPSKTTVELTDGAIQ